MDVSKPCGLWLRGTSWSLLHLGSADYPGQVLLWDVHIENAAVTRLQPHLCTFLGLSTHPAKPGESSGSACKGSDKFQVISLLIQKIQLRVTQTAPDKKKIIQYFLGKSPIILFDILKMKCYSSIFQQESFETKFAQTQAFYI